MLRNCDMAIKDYESLNINKYKYFLLSRITTTTYTHKLRKTTNVH